MKKFRAAEAMEGEQEAVVELQHSDASWTAASDDVAPLGKRDDADAKPTQVKVLYCILYCCLLSAQHLLLVDRTGKANTRTTRGPRPGRACRPC